MDLRLALAIVLIVGYVAYKAYERSGAKLPLGLGMGMGRRRSIAARKPPAPDKLAFERVTLDATDANLQSFIRLTGALDRLGFHVVADYAIAGWPDTACRGFVHKDKPVHATIVERHGLPAHVELFTLFDDLSALITSGSEEAEDPSKPLALRFQQIPGLTVDELFVQHISSLENLYQDQLNAMPALRLAYFEHQRALLVIEHELRKAKRALRTDSLSRVLDALPELPVKDLLKRYGLEEPGEEAPEAESVTVSIKTIPAQERVEAPTESEEAPRKWGIGSSLLSKRMAARQEAESPVDAPVGSEAVATLVLEPAPIAEPALEVTVAEATAVIEIEPEAEIRAPEPEAILPLPFEVGPEPSEPPSEPEAAMPLPFESVPEPVEPEPEAIAPLPFEIVPAETEPVESVDPLPFEAPAATEGPTESVPAEPAIKLPFEIVPEEPTAEAEPLPFAVVPDEPASVGETAATSSKPTCPHCGATLFSSLSSRCSKCKQAVR